MEESNMEHRNSISQSQMPEMENEQIPNSQSSDPRLNLGTGSMMLPSENLSAREFTSLSYGMTCLPTTILPLQNNGSEIPSYLPDHSRVMHDSYMHSLSASNSAQVQPYYAPLGPCYNQIGVSGLNATTNPQLEYGRASYKRKFPSSPEVNMGGCYGAGSSSNSSISAEHFHTKRMYWPRDYENNIMPTQEGGSERNVRSRHGSTHHLETAQPAVHSVVPQDFHLLAGTSEPAMPAHWGHNPASFDSHPLANSSAVETSSLNHEGDTSNIVSYIHNGNVEVDGNSHPNLNPDRAFPLLPTHSGPLAGGFMAARSSYNQRSAFRAIPSYPSAGIAANMSDARLPRFEISVPPRYSRPVSIAPRSTDRNGRARSRYDRYQPFSDSGTRVRWVSGGVTMMERASFYDSRHLYDQHRGMRLDIDNMSYEELLELEERIGSVSTGLSEDAISRCLMEKIYCSSVSAQDEPEQEKKCSICLEEYQDKDQLGTLKCSHYFHFGCIRQWLLIKNVCPICKVAASDDTQ